MKPLHYTRNQLEARVDQQRAILEAAQREHGDREDIADLIAFVRSDLDDLQGCLNSFRELSHLDDAGRRVIDTRPYRRMFEMMPGWSGG